MGMYDITSLFLEKKEEKDVTATTTKQFAQQSRRDKRVLLADDSR